MGWRWRGVLLVEGVETGDHRLIEPGATRWRTLPLDFRAVFEDGWGGHENATPVATVETIEMRDGGVVWGDGPVLVGDETADHWRNIASQHALCGVSVDLTGGSVRIEVVDGDTGEVIDDDIAWDLYWMDDDGRYYVREVWSDAEIGAVTAVGTPAFAEATVEVYEDDVPVDVEVPSAEGNPEAAATGATFATIEEVAVGDEVTWVEQDDEGNNIDHNGTVTAVDEEAETVTVDEDGTTVTLPVADVTVTADDSDDDDAEGSATSQVAERFGTLTRIAGASANPRPALSALLARDRGDVVTASGLMRTGGRGAVLTASVAWDEGPPLDAFSTDGFDGPTPWTIDDDGFCYGHLALWGQCHSGYMNGAMSECVVPTPSPTNYALFHSSGRVRCADGSRVSVGTISMDTNHAPAGTADRRPSVAATRRHYDDTGYAAMQIHVFDDDHGMAARGIVAPGVDIEHVRRAMAAKPSVDMRDHGNGLDLLGVLMVNVPGWPVYEIEDGRTTVLMASLSPVEGAKRPKAVGAAASSGGGCGGACGTCSCSGGDDAAAKADRFEHLRRSPRARLAMADRAMV